jgi:hypothetical protein
MRKGTASRSRSRSYSSYYPKPSFCPFLILARELDQDVPESNVRPYDARIPSKNFLSWMRVFSFSRQLARLLGPARGLYLNVKQQAHGLGCTCRAVAPLFRFARRDRSPRSPRPHHLVRMRLFLEPGQETQGHECHERDNNRDVIGADANRCSHSTGRPDARRCCCPLHPILYL